MFGDIKVSQYLGNSLKRQLKCGTMGTAFLFE